MTFGDLDKVLPDSPEHQETQWLPFDWSSESYQLMCREYRMSLGIVHPENYESKYETGSEYLYWKNLHKVRGYWPYDRKCHYNGIQIVKHVIPDPPDAWQQEWASKNGINIRDDTSSKTPAITAEQGVEGQEHLKRLESVCIKDEKGEITAITDANLLSEFQIWMAEESLTVNEETAKLIRDSWTGIFDEDKRAIPAEAATALGTDSSPYQELD